MQYSDTINHDNIDELEDELIELELLRRRGIQYHTGETDPVIKMGKRGVNLIVVGAPNSGKTSLCRRFDTDDYSGFRKEA